MSTPTSQIPQSTDMADGFEERLYQRATLKKNPLSTIPTNAMHEPHGNIPNTPLAASTISFLLGSIFSLALLAFISGAMGISSQSYYQLGFFVTAWAGFHWAEFAVTAGWNLDKCSVDCKHRLRLCEPLLMLCRCSFPSGQWCNVPHCKWYRCRRISHYDLFQARAQITTLHFNNR
jgi:hypothetical protein